MVQKYKRRTGEWDDLPWACTVNLGILLSTMSRSSIYLDPVEQPKYRERCDSVSAIQINAHTYRILNSRA